MSKTFRRESYDRVERKRRAEGRRNRKSNGDWFRRSNDQFSQRDVEFQEQELRRLLQL